MAYTSNGANSVVNQISVRFETDRFGVDSIEMAVEIPDASFPSSMLAEGAQYPPPTPGAVSPFPNMSLTRRTGQRGKPGWWSVNYVFEGFLVSLPDPTYELTTSLSQEPIQTHPDFSTFAGTPASPNNNSIFIDPETGLRSQKINAIWKEFAVSGSANEKGGIESYLAPGAEWRETKFQETRPTGIRDVGTIEPPVGPNPTLSGRNWLAWGETYVRRGHIYQVTSTWKLSGRNGWDTDIYS